MFSLGKFSDKNLLDTSFLITNICGLQLVSNFFVINSIFLDFFTILFKKPLLSFYKGKLCKKKTAKVYLCIKVSNAVISRLHPRF